MPRRKTTPRAQDLKAHINAGLAVRGKALRVERVLGGRLVAHIAKELGFPRQCAYRWVRRYRAEGKAGLSGRSSRRHSMQSLTSPERDAAVLEVAHANALARPGWPPTPAFPHGSCRGC
ncbi:leucine zipper domain-containing protein [Cryobacterium sp. Y50]|uniref:helix-turn-helix domain-containing protein n=1 Tax=Cryobacterium sp. Y50 TaxID=2048286 RepID=UPI000CE5694C